MFFYMFHMCYKKASLSLSPSLFSLALSLHGSKGRGRRGGGTPRRCVLLGRSAPGISSGQSSVSPSTLAGLFSIRAHKGAAVAAVAAAICRSAAMQPVP